MSQPDSAPSSYESIGIQSHPQGWGQASKTVTPDGAITGDHMSGGPSSPSVYQSSSTVSPEDMARLEALVAALLDARPQDSQARDQNKAGYRSVFLVVDDSTRITIHADWDGSFEPPEAQEVWELVSKHKVGAW